MNAQTDPIPSRPCKVRILYADDRSENVRSLLEGMKSSGLVPENLGGQLILHQLDLEHNQQHNHEILHHSNCLVELDYATLMNEAIERVRDPIQNYDLIISDWYFGEHDPASKDSQIGGIWVMLWGRQRNREIKPVCKLYTGQLGTMQQQRIDYVFAKEYIKTVFRMEVSEIPKSETPDSWQQHLESYLKEVAGSLMQHANKSDLVEVINHITSRITFSRFNNCIEDNIFDSFLDDLFRLSSFSLRLNDGRTMQMAHVFPLLLGRYLCSEGRFAFACMTPDEISTLLFAKRLFFSERDARNEKIRKLRGAGVECMETRDHDATGNPLYGIQVKSENYYEGPLATITDLLIGSLDFTFKIQSFYLNENGFNGWLHSRKAPGESAGIDDVRKDIILPEFEKLKPCFNRTPVELPANLPSLGIQLMNVLSTMDVERIREEAADGTEKSMDDRFVRLQKQPLVDEKSKKLLLPIASLFRIKVHDFLTNLLQPGMRIDFDDIDDEYESIESRDVYWYCHAWLVREGIRTIVNNMRGSEKRFIVLNPRNVAATPIVRYKIVLRDNGKGMGSVARAFIPQRGYLSHAARHLKDFCELMVRSKMEGDEAIEYDVFGGVTDAPCSKMKKTGTEFEITFTQRRDR